MKKLILLLILSLSAMTVIVAQTVRPVFVKKPVFKYYVLQMGVCKRYEPVGNGDCKCTEKSCYSVMYSTLGNTGIPDGIMSITTIPCPPETSIPTPCSRIVTEITLETIRQWIEDHPEDPKPVDELKSKTIK